MRLFQLTIAFCFAVTLSAATATELEEEFSSPPDTARRKSLVQYIKAGLREFRGHHAQLLTADKKRGQVDSIDRHRQ